jgi:Histidine kinase-like ATPase domain
MSPAFISQPTVRTAKTMSPARVDLATSSTDWPWLQAAASMAALSFEPCEAGGATARWTTAPRVATRTPALAAHSVATARAFALRTLQRWSEPGRAADVAAVVSELLTNALRHSLPDEYPVGTTARWPIRLGLLHTGPCLLCAVADPSERAPVPRHPGCLDEDGRGLQLVESLSDQWGFCPAPDGLGKVVWATFATQR